MKTNRTKPKDKRRLYDKIINKQLSKMGMPFRIKINKTVKL